jgi:hypothetical protein
LFWFAVCHLVSLAVPHPLRSDITNPRASLPPVSLLNSFSLGSLASTPTTYASNPILLVGANNALVEQSQASVNHPQINSWQLARRLPLVDFTSYQSVIHFDSISLRCHHNDLFSCYFGPPSF